MIRTDFNALQGIRNLAGVTKKLPQRRHQLSRVKLGIIDWARIVNQTEYALSRLKMMGTDNICLERLISEPKAMTVETSYIYRKGKLEDADECKMYYLCKKQNYRVVRTDRKPKDLFVVQEYDRKERKKVLDTL